MYDLCAIFHVLIHVLLDITCLLDMFCLVVFSILGGHGIRCALSLHFSAPTFGGFVVKMATVGTLGFLFEETILGQVVALPTNVAGLLCLRFSCSFLFLSGTL